MWPAVSSSSCCDFPTVMDYKMELGAKPNPFFLRLLFNGLSYYNSKTRTRTVAWGQWWNKWSVSLMSHSFHCDCRPSFLFLPYLSKSGVLLQDTSPRITEPFQCWYLKVCAPWKQACFHLQVELESFRGILFSFLSLGASILWVLDFYVSMSSMRWYCGWVPRMGTVICVLLAFSVKGVVLLETFRK